MRDCFVCGLHNTSIHQKLLATEKLTMAQAQQLAVSDEAARKDEAQLSRAYLHSSPSKIHAMTSPITKPFQRNKTRYSKERASTNQYVPSSSASPCRHCGRKNPQSADCMFKTAICHNAIVRVTLLRYAVTLL